MMSYEGMVGRTSFGGCGQCNWNGGGNEMLSFLSSTLPQYQSRISDLESTNTRLVETIHSLLKERKEDLDRILALERRIDMLAGRENQRGDNNVVRDGRKGSIAPSEISKNILGIVSPPRNLKKGLGKSPGIKLNGGNSGNVSFRR